MMHNIPSPSKGSGRLPAILVSTMVVFVIIFFILNQENGYQLPPEPTKAVPEPRQVPLCATIAAHQKEEVLRVEDSAHNGPSVAPQLPQCRLFTLVNGREQQKPGRFIPTFGHGNPHLSNCSSEAGQLHYIHFLRPPFKSTLAESDGKYTPLTFAKFNARDWLNFCTGGSAPSVSDLVVPDKLAFIFIADEASWELESIQNHIAPHILRLPADNDSSTPSVVMTFHLAYPTWLANPATAAVGLAETIACLVEHLSLWMDENIIGTLLKNAQGSVVVSERRVSPQRLNAFLAALEAIRVGKGPASAVAALNLPNLLEPKSKRRRYATPLISNEEANAVVQPLGVPPSDGQSLRHPMPIIRTISGVSDEELIGDPLVRYSGRWAQLGGGRVYLRQYSPKFLRNVEYNSSAETTPLARNINVVLSGFRGFNSTVRLTPHHSLRNAVKDRVYLWSFLGKIRNADRKVMVATLNKWAGARAEGPTKSFCCDSVDTKLAGPQALYTNTIFVPIGRGQLSLDCFRIYEAAFSGAIPVISSPLSNNEFQDTFGHYANSRGSLPPFVFAPTWQEAVIVLERLLGSPDELELLQRRVVDWVFENFHYTQRSYLGVG